MIKQKHLLKLLDLDLSNENNFSFQKDKQYFLQELTYTKYNEDLPYFVLPISSATHDNINGIKYALYDLISRDKCERTSLKSRKCCFNTRWHTCIRKIKKFSKFNIFTKRINLKLYLVSSGAVAAGYSLMKFK